MAEVFVGQILPVAFLFAPVDFAQCNGQQLVVQQYQALFSLLGITYGGNGQTNFNLPNLQGRAIFHAGTNPDTQVFYQQGSTGKGSAVVAGSTAQGVLAANNIPQLPLNGTQSLAASTTINAVTGPTTRVALPVGNLITSAVANTTPQATVLGYVAPASGQTTGALASGAATTTISGSIGGTVGNLTPTPFSMAVPAQQIPTLPPYQTLLYVIATQGIYPQRP